jgi:hypothetical protein
MEPFTLEKYLQNPQREIVTGEGRPVRILCTDIQDPRDNRQIVAAVSYDTAGELVFRYDATGDAQLKSLPEANLYFKGAARVGYVNIFRDEKNTVFTGAEVYDTRESAIEGASVTDWWTLLATVRVEYTE